MIELGVNTESETAINLYKSIGFEIMKTNHNKQTGDGITRDLFIMRLET